MAKATVAQTWKLDDIPEASLAQPHGHAWHVLTNAAWELWRNRLATVGAAMVLLLLLVAVLAPVIARYDPVQQHYREMLQSPSAAHYFGTDKFGRDIWSRVVWGARRSAMISVLAVIAGVIGGIPLGTISGYYGGKLDAVLMRVVDAWLAFPGILFYLIAATIIQAYKLSLLLEHRRAHSRPGDSPDAQYGPSSARRGSGRARARICGSSTRRRRGASLHCVPATPAQLPVASHYPGHDLARFCHAHPRRPLFPVPGCAATHP
jgi:hypothetical protein